MASRGDLIYSPLFPRSASLNSCPEGDPAAPHIEFTGDLDVYVGSRIKGISPMHGSASDALPLHHSHVLWSYFLILSPDVSPASVLGTPGPVTYSLYLVSCGPHLERMTKAQQAINKPKKLDEPRVLRATATTLLGATKQEGETFEFSDRKAGHMNSIFLNKKFTESDLRTLAVKDDLRVRLRITIDRSYFDWSRLVDRIPDSSDEQRELVGAILSGRKAEGCDWIIETPRVVKKGRVVQQSATLHVHKDRFAAASDLFKRALSTRKSVKGLIQFVAGENKCILPGFTPDTIEMVIFIIYGLPPWPTAHTIKSMTELCALLSQLFSPRILDDVVYPALEFFMCDMAERAKKASEPDATRLLTGFLAEVWSCPEGATPVAERVLLGMFADKMYVNFYAGKDIASMMAVILKDVDPQEPDFKVKLMTSAQTFLRLVPQVRKRGVTMAAKVPEQPPPPLEDDMLSKLTEMLNKQNAYNPVIPHTRSLGACEGHAAGDRIEFSRDFAYTMTELIDTALAKTGDGFQSQVIPLWFSHVLWCFGLRVKRVEDDSYELMLVSVGPHTATGKTAQPDPDHNSPKGLAMPRVLTATIAFLGKEMTSIETLKLTPSLVAPKRFSMGQLKGLFVADSLQLRVCITVDRSYFSLGKIIDLEAKTTVPASLQQQIGAILCGEKPADADWEITVPKDSDSGDAPSSPCSFHVHASVLADASPAAKRVMDTGRPFVYQIRPVPGNERGCLMAKLTPEDMKVVIPLIYRAEVPLPGDRPAALVNTLRTLFMSDLLTDHLYPQWERAICQSALAIDKSSLSSLRSLARLLSLVWACPFGSMPVAKRIVVGVMADTVHQQARGDLTGFHEKMSVEMGAMADDPSKFASMFAHLHAVVMVRKTLLAPEAGPADTVATIVAPPPRATASSPRSDVVIDLPDEEDEQWHDAVSIDNQPKAASKFGCTIS